MNGVELFPDRPVSSWGNAATDADSPGKSCDVAAQQGWYRNLHEHLLVSIFCKKYVIVKVMELLFSC